MAHINTYKLKVGFRLFGKHWKWCVVTFSGIVVFPFTVMSLEPPVPGTRMSIGIGPCGLQLRNQIIVPCDLMYSTLPTDLFLQGLFVVIVQERSAATWTHGRGPNRGQACAQMGWREASLASTDPCANEPCRGERWAH